MNIRYKCACMNKEREITVTDRIAGSDIRDWMDSVILMSVGYHHRSISPSCKFNKTEFIKIPVPEEGGEIGVPRVSN